MQQLKPLQHDDHCVACGVELPAGTRAYWRETDRVARCVYCQAGQAERRAEPTHNRRATDPPSGPEPSEPSTGDQPLNSVGVAGRSAQRQHERRAARELERKEEAAKATPTVQITPESQPTRAWKIGAEGERRAAEVLDKVRGIRVLHDRRVPGSLANIDHIAVGPAGVFVIDSKNYSCRLEFRRGIARPTDVRLYFNNRKRLKLFDGVRSQTEVVTTALGDEFRDVPVQGVLCFVGSDWGLRGRAKVIRGIKVLCLAELADFVSADGPFAYQDTGIAKRLQSHLRPAV